MTDTPPALWPLDANKLSVRATISLMILLVNVACFGLLFWVAVPKENADLIKSMVQMFQTAFNLVIGYWLGSSKGSADKTAILGKGAGQ